MVQFTDLKITTEITQKNENISTDKGLKNEKSSQEKNQFEKMLTQIRQLLKGKNIAESGKPLKELINISLNNPESNEIKNKEKGNKNELLSQELLTELIENNVEKEKQLPLENDFLLEKSDENLELKSILIGINTQMGTKMRMGVKIRTGMEQL